MLKHEPDLRSRTGSGRGLFPVQQDAPVSERSRPAMMRRSVVLPEPDGPRSDTSSPVSILRFTPLSAV
jgi:hypothetical protein